ncbi:MAG: T9SS type A sorting domain-containing protein, partial [Bacteroidota bacterium]
IILADLDGDNEIELMWDDNTSGAIYQGYNHDGTVMDGWPLDTQFYSFFINPFVTDVNNDGITDISGGGCDVNGTWDSPTYLWDTGADYHPELSELPVFQYNLQHTGVYVTPTSANVQDIIVEDSINISPNPSNGVFSVNIDLKQNDQEIFVDIIDVNGKIIQSSPIILNSNSFYEINISDHVEGVYFVKIMTNNQLYFQKIIKR